MTAALALGLCLSGCGVGLGSGPGEGEVELSVTRDYGAAPIVGPEQVGLRSSDSVMRILDRSAEVETSYGGRFVDSIDGLEMTSSPRSRDWFYFVNGVAPEIGAAEYDLDDGDSIWWDYRDWTAVMDVGAVTGSYPAPLDRTDDPVPMTCSAPGRLCRLVERHLADDGVRVDPGTAKPGGETVVVEVGTFEQLGTDRAAVLGPDSGPAESGVFAKFAGKVGGNSTLEVLDPTGTVAERFGAGAGLVAALRYPSGPTVWLVTGTDEAGLEAAAGLLDPGALASTYAVVAPPGGRAPISVPTGDTGGGSGS